MKLRHQILALAITIPVGIVLSGYTAVKLWLWFIVPLDVGPISLWHSVGLILVSTFAVKNLATIPDSPSVEEATAVRVAAGFSKDLAAKVSRLEHESRGRRRLIQAIVKSILFPLFALMAGYMFHTLAVLFP